MSPTIRHKHKYFYSAVQRAKDRRQKFHFCRLPFDVRPRNVKLNLSNSSKKGERKVMGEVRGEKALLPYLFASLFSGLLYITYIWEARWPHGWYARLLRERSGFKPWPGTLCCVLGQDT